MIQHKLQLEFVRQADCRFKIARTVGRQHDGFLAIEIREQRFQFQITLGGRGLGLLVAGSVVFLAVVVAPLRLVVLRVEECLPQLRGQAHARRRKLTLIEATLVAAFVAGKVQRHGEVADQQHLSSGGAGQLNEGILSGKRVSTGGSDDGISNAVHTRDRDERGLSVERLPRTHMGHNLVAHLD